jgi:hypothetical protein
VPEGGFLSCRVELLQSLNTFRQCLLNRKEETMVKIGLF